MVGNEMGPPALERLNLLFRGKALIAAAYKLEPVLGALESDLDLRVASQAGPERIFIRVGVVGWQGRAIVVGGEPRGGTSTLVAAMLRAGASYYSDQYAVLDSRGWVYPYARPLWLSSGARGNPVRYRPEELGSTAGMEAQKVGTVVFVSYRPGARQWLIRLEQSTVEADLMDYAVCARQYQREAQSAVSKALAGARIFRGVCGEADSFVDLLLR
ncbi:MAG TPA: hypothetical protein VKB84_14270 [Candidatus Binataceae bacterium]|nr:hypothetical protein [Candidatus Binataceae bacterium]